MAVKLISKKSEDLSVDELVDLAEEASYIKSKRLREICSIVVFAVLSVVAVAQLTTHREVTLMRVPSMFLATFLGILGADFTSGLVHWTLDSWGSIDMPLIGKGLMIPFREHHIDPTAFTRRDFIVTWGDTCMVTIPFLAPLTYLLCFSDPEHIKTWYILYLILTVGITVSATNNQTHKWAHTRSRNFRWVEWLQKHHLLLPKAHHHTHHCPPHTINYCIITGWANYPLEYINFWRHLEWFIEKTTGYKPRQDDMKWSKKKQHFMKLSNNLAIRLAQETKLN